VSGIRANTVRLGQVAAPISVTAALIALCGIILAWSPWAIVAVLAGLALVVAGFGLVSRKRWRTPRYRPNLPRTTAVAMAAVAVVTALVMLWQWSIPQHRYDRDVRAVADQSSRLAELLTTVTPETRAGYVDGLRPLVVDGAAEALKAQVLDPMPPGVVQTGKVRAVGVQAIVDDGASAVVVVEPSPPPAEPSAAYPDETKDIVLWFLLVRQDGQWKLKHMAPMFP
jgi:hypothetical protein